ncbi:MAG: MarR family transcriptional regulator [Pseudomonadota bacterium]|nr:MarR family transcriptional regulator [Pseudomonadota bacterium]
MSVKPPDFHLEHFLPYLVHRVGSRLAEGFKDGFDEVGLNLQEWRAAAVLYEFGPQTMGDIARRTNINASTMTRLIGQMEKNGLVERERPMANQRNVYVRLLEEGSRRVQTLIPKVIDYETDLSACFSDAELQTFKLLLEKLFHSLVRDTPDTERLAG